MVSKKGARRSTSKSVVKKERRPQQRHNAVQRGVDSNANSNATTGGTPSSIDKIDIDIDMLSAAIVASKDGICSSLSEEECMGICEAIVDDHDHHHHHDEDDDDDDSQNFVGLLCDYLDLKEPEARSILNNAYAAAASVSVSPRNDQSDCDADSAVAGSDSEKESNVDSDQDDDNDNDNDDDDDDSSTGSVDEYVQEGECELCEREMKLTLHHLIPKCTWKRIKPRFQQASQPYAKGDMETVHRILDLGWDDNGDDDHHDHLLQNGITSKTFSGGRSTTLFLAGYTAKVCAPCHKCIHANHDHMELAERFNTVEKILEDERIYKFCKWQSKQRPGKYSLRK